MMVAVLRVLHKAMRLCLFYIQTSLWDLFPPFGSRIFPANICAFIIDWQWCSRFIFSLPSAWFLRRASSMLFLSAASVILSLCDDSGGWKSPYCGINGLRHESHSHLIQNKVNRDAERESKSETNNNIMAALVAKAGGRIQKIYY